MHEFMIYMTLGLMNIQLDHAVVQFEKTPTTGIRAGFGTVLDLILGLIQKICINLMKYLCCLNFQIYVFIFLNWLCSKLG